MHLSRFYIVAVLLLLGLSAFVFNEKNVLANANLNKPNSNSVSEPQEAFKTEAETLEKPPLETYSKTEKSQLARQNAKTDTDTRFSSAPVELGDKPVSFRFSKESKFYSELTRLANNKFAAGDHKAYFDWHEYSVTATKNQDGSLTFDLIDKDIFTRFSSSEEIVQHNLAHLNNDDESGRWDIHREEQFRAAATQYINNVNYNVNLLTCREHRCVAEIFIEGGASQGAKGLAPLLDDWQTKGHVAHGLYFGNSVWSLDVYFDS
ncbi:hypothetical protein [Aestuariibacter salexigens]|uniref:hypothetical protein n=1 Tax=Aestuariibacter salexigens TaxID=226010 RepID=UPI0003F82B60|nr:hypothetical protein [Aestuariibacter salexigens]